MFSIKQQTGLESLLDRRRQRPSRWERFWSTPCAFLAQCIYTHRRISQKPPTNPVKIVCISDTHNSLPDLPSGDVLVHAGDLTQSGSLKELKAVITWLNSQPHPHKISHPSLAEIVLALIYD